MKFLALIEGVKTWIDSLSAASGASDKLISTNSEGKLDSSFLSKTWFDLASGWRDEPVLITTITEGEVYSYTYEGDITYYRLIGATEDAFYEGFSNNAVSGFIVRKRIAI